MRPRRSSWPRSCRRRSHGQGSALWGGYLRNAGLFLFLACLVLFAAVVRISDAGFLRRLAFALVATGGLLSFYSVLQHFGADPISWYNFAYSNPFATFGNPDFAGAFYAIALPLAIWAAVWAGLHLYWRIASGAVAVLLLVGIELSGAAQGYVGAAVAIFVLLLGWLFTQRAEIRRRGLVASTAAGALVLGLLAAGLAGRGPLGRLGGTGAVDIRLHFWHVAMSMFTDHPVAGVGMNMYGDHFRAYRSQSIVDALGYTDAPDVPHSVQVAMFADGGLLLGLSYLAFVVAVGVALIQSPRRDDGPGVMLTAALGAAWAAFQVESTVSINVVPLAVLHFVLAGAIVARGGVTWKTIPVEGPRPAAPQRHHHATAQRAGRQRCAVAGLVLAWFAIQPLRADVHYHSATQAAARGDAQEAFDQIKMATDEAGWQGVYWLERSKDDGQLGRIQDGLDDVRRAIDANPRNVDAAASLARVEATLGDKEAAARWYRYAIRLDPLNPDLRQGLADLDKPP